MATVTLDTHRIVKRLKDAGFTDTQAETVTDIIAETAATDPADIATRPASLRCARRSGPTSPRWKPGS